jgi:hypothetical protein
MTAKNKQPQADLYITTENQDWIAIHGTREELAKLARELLDFARADGPEEHCQVQDPIAPFFRPGSLGYTFYRRKPGWTEIDEP